MIVKNKTQLIFMIGASVAGVLIVGCAVLLFMSHTKLKKVERSTKAKQVRLEALSSGNPFPSEENVQIELKNGEALRSWLNTLSSTAAEGQLNLDMRTPSKFRRLLGKTVTQLIHAGGADVVSENFFFGFNRYLVDGSELPQPDHVPRLAQQLAVVDRVCGILFDANITQLRGVTREVFEGSRKEMALTGTDSGAGVLNEGDLYGKLRFKFEFSATEDAFFDVMNRIASNELFMSVGTIQYTKPKVDVHEDLIPEAGKASLGTDEAPLDPEEQEVEVDDQGRLFPSRYRRIVSGHDHEVPMDISMELNVFQFVEVKTE
jgi:hypothetical protein